MFLVILGYYEVLNTKEKVTTILIYSLGSTKVYVGTPESLNTSCKKAM